MSSSFHQFGKSIVTAGLIPADELKALWIELPAATRPHDAQSLAALLVERGKLTEYQAAQLLAGQTAGLLLGDYVVLSQLGAGGMGQVFKAHHRCMERTVALKLIATSAMKDEAAVKRFHREVKAAARLTHPNIVIAHDAGQSGGQHYLVMEYVAGRDLSETVKQSGPLPLAQALDCVRQAACGLAFAHSEGVIHRDIKPANLLLDKKGTVKILDMGLARIDEAGDELTATEQVMGTIDYMSPEQAASTHAVDGRADVYSLGCTLWFLLTGRKIYDGDTLMSRMLKHRDASIPSLCRARDDIPPGVDQVFQRMVAKRPEDRYATMDEVLHTFDRLQGELLESAAPATSDSALNQFFHSIGPATSIRPETRTRTVTAPTSADAATVDFGQAAIGTDPKSEASVLPLAKTKGREREALVSRWYRRPHGPRSLAIVAGGAAGFFALLLGVIVTIRNDQGKKIARINAPAGATVEVKATNPKIQIPNLKSPAPSGQPLASSPNYELDLSAIVDDTTFAHVNLPKRSEQQPSTFELFARPRSNAETLQNRGLVLSRSVTLKQSKANWRWLVNGKDYVPTREGHGVRSQSPIKLGQRVHLAGVIEGQTLRLYVDGRPSGISSFSESLSATSSGVSLGKAAILETWSPFDGTIDEVRITDGVRYTQDFRPQERLEPDATTWGLYHCDEGSGDTLVDSSGNSRHGKVVGAKWVRANASDLPAVGDGSGVRGQASVPAKSPSSQ